VVLGTLFFIVVRSKQLGLNQSLLGGTNRVGE